jgi:hypothetical protein
MQAVGWEKLLNRQGTTWRKLDDTTRNSAVDAASAAAVSAAALADATPKSDAPLLEGLAPQAVTSGRRK